MFIWGVLPIISTTYTPARFSDGSVNDLKVGNYIDRAMSKVEAWPDTHDNKNTVIAAGVAYGVFCPWPPQPERVITFA